ncbi:MAG: hypothetical protein WBU92_06530, partial [Candidatus Dormiibacterota bacterium]
PRSAHPTSDQGRKSGAIDAACQILHRMERQRRERRSRRREAGPPAVSRSRSRTASRAGLAVVHRHSWR